MGDELHRSTVSFAHQWPRWVTLLAHGDCRH